MIISAAVGALVVVVLAVLVAVFLVFRHRRLESLRRLDRYASTVHLIQWLTCVCPMVPRDKCSLAHVEVKMCNEFIQFDWPFYGRPVGGKKGCAWEGVLAGRPYACALTTVSMTFSFTKLNGAAKSSMVCQQSM